MSWGGSVGGESESGESNNGESWEGESVVETVEFVVEVDVADEPGMGDEDWVVSGVPDVPGESPVSECRMGDEEPFIGSCVPPAHQLPSPLTLLARMCIKYTHSQQSKIVSITHRSQYH